MTRINNGGPAFPVTDFVVDSKAGMSLRDWVMGQCIAAAFSLKNQPLDIMDGETSEDALRRYWGCVAVAAAIAADAMIAERAK